MNNIEIAKELFQNSKGVLKTIIKEYINKMFDLAVWNKEDLTPRFLNDESNEEDANSIEEAIEKYCVYIHNY